jgi:hypothetical protein
MNLEMTYNVADSLGVTTQKTTIYKLLSPYVLYLPWHKSDNKLNGEI